MPYVNPNDPTRTTVQPSRGGNPSFDTHDETGVPWRNRAAEWRRKAERDEQRLEAERAAREELEAQVSELAGQQGQPAVQLGGGSAQGPAAYLGPPSGQQYGQPGGSAVLDTNTLERVVDNVLLKRRNESDYHDEMALLGKVWPAYNDEDEQSALCDYLRKKGYPDEEIERFGPRDVRFAYEAMRAEGRAARRATVRPQELALDTGDGVTEQGNDEGDYTESQIAAMSPEQLDEMVNATLRAPRDYGED